MFELLCIFTSGGLVLWNQGSLWAPLNVLIAQVLQQERTHLTSFSHNGYIMKWELLPKYELVFAAVYQELYPVFFVENLLQAMKEAFLSVLEQKKVPLRSIRFADDFQMLYSKWVEDSKHHVRKADTPEDFQIFLPRPSENSSDSSPTHSLSKPTPQTDKKPKSKKLATSWGIDNKVTKRKIHNLDVSKDRTQSLASKPAYLSGEASSSSEEEEKELGFFSRLANKVKSNFTGNKEITQSDLDPLIGEFKSLLISKNVAESISSQFCASVCSSLLHTRTASFTSLSTTVRAALSTSIERLLTPDNYKDLLKEALDAKAQRRPYVIVFCGINGVGKSTSLAKVGYYLKTRGELKIMIAACDTFRSGAIEQLTVHSKTLEVPLFEQGYGKEPGFVAKEAVKAAKTQGIDVVLVDTAGRMQHNEALMVPLATLVNMNQPDAVLFVGEALVGNDGVDQLITFNRALTQRTENARGVDGIVLTKFDSVDDKVGAALSMVYSTGKPIVFIGVGERYPHLKRLNAKTVVRSLLS
jgi:signal recognition particle receptor subunit alpha